MGVKVSELKDVSNGLPEETELSKPQAGKAPASQDPDPKAYVPEPFVPIGDEEAISRLTDLVNRWDSIPNSRPPGLTPLLFSDDEEQRRVARESAAQAKELAERMALERAGRIAIEQAGARAERVAAEMAKIARERAARISKLARWCPVPPSAMDDGAVPPQKLMHRPHTARSPRAKQTARTARPSSAINGDRLPHANEPAWPLPKSVKESKTTLLQESTPRLYQWWADGGNTPSPINMMLPRLLDKHGLARIARSNGENAMRAGYLRGAAPYFERAAELAPVDATLRWRLNEVNAVLHGGLKIVREISMSKNGVDSALKSVSWRETNFDSAGKIGVQTEDTITVGERFTTETKNTLIAIHDHGV